MKTTVVIPNYNGMNYISICLNSLRNQKYTDFRIIVVDNASQDGSYEFIRDTYPEVELYRNKVNKGFSAAVNRGIEESDTEYVILLNNDTEVHPNFVFELEQSIEKSSQIFSVGAKMVQFQQRDRIDSAGDFYTIMGWGFQRGNGKKVSHYDREERIFSACAGAAIYRRKVFDEIGMFDEAHFAYMEDMDICYRAAIYGYQNWYCPKAVVYHIGSATSGSKHNEFKVRLAARNNVYIVYKNMPVVQFMINFPFLVGGFLAKYLYFRKIGLGKVYKTGFLEGLKTCYQRNRIPYESRNFEHYVQIEKDILYSTLLFIKEKL